MPTSRARFSAEGSSRASSSFPDRTCRSTRSASGSSEILSSVVLITRLEGSGLARDLRAVLFDRANEQPHPHRGRDRLKGRIPRRPAGEDASNLPERNPGSRGEGPQPFLRDSLAHRPHEDVLAEKYGLEMIDLTAEPVEGEGFEPRYPEVGEEIPSGRCSGSTR